MNNVANIQRAAAHIDATELADGDWAHYADETGTWWVVTSEELAELCEYLDSDDQQVSRDAYSHWCAGTSAREMPAGWEPGAEPEAVTVELTSPNGPRVEHGPGDDEEAVEAAIPAGYSVDFSSQITLASGRFRAPLVLETVPSSRLAYVADSDGRVVRILGDVVDGSPEEAELARSAPAGTSLVALECDATVGDRVLVDDRGVASEVVS